MYYEIKHYKGSNSDSVKNLHHCFYSSWFQTKAGKVIRMEFETISLFEGYFLITVRIMLGKKTYWNVEQKLTSPYYSWNIMSKNPPCIYIASAAPNSLRGRYRRQGAAHNCVKVCMPLTQSWSSKRRPRSDGRQRSRAKRSTAHSVSSSGARECTSCTHCAL